MAGCECGNWKNAIGQEAVYCGEGMDEKLYSRPAWFVSKGLFSIHFCPWCGSKLTKPEGGSKLTEGAEDEAK